MSQVDCKTRICWKYVKTVKSIISKNELRTQIWNNQCFAKWLNVQSTQPDGQLIHVVLLHQVDINLEPEFDGISYLIGGPFKENLRFGPREFCLITGFMFGDNTKAKHGGFSFINRVLSENIVIPFPVDSLKTLLEEKEDLFEDEVVVRLCLFLLLYSFFMGVETTKLVEQDHLLLVDNLQFWNEYNGDLI
ncbi:hypothetical protein R6Q59_023656 [Mikania micrantha]